MNDFPVRPEELLGWASRLIAIPSYPGVEAQERAAAEYIRSVFEAEGVECRIDPLENGRANVLARLRGTGGGRSLLLNGHTDTVPPYGMADACAPRLENGRLRGRGSTDMKGQLACMMACLLAIKRSGRPLAGDLIFSGVADEECGSLGCIDLIEKGVRADAAVVCEGLGVPNIAVAQKGLEWYGIDFTGRAVHGGSQDRGVNAILLAARCIRELETVLRPALDERLHPYLGRSTMNLAVIRGGTQPSTVPGECTLQLDRRFLPGAETHAACGAELQAVLDRLAAEDPAFRARLRVLPASVMRDGFVHQGFETDPDGPLARCCRESVRAVTGGEASLIGCPCWTDAGLLSHYARIPTVVWGPGSLELAHSERESVSAGELYEGARCYAELARRFCG